MGSFDFFSVSQAPEVSNVGANDYVVVVTSEGVRRITPSVLGQSMNVALTITPWDVEASAVEVDPVPLPYRRTYQLGASASATGIPDVDAAAFKVTKKSKTVENKDRVAWSIRGALPTTGTYWVVLEAQCSDPSTTHTIFIGDDLDTALRVRTASGGQLATITAQQSGIAVSYDAVSPSVADSVAVTQTIQKIMLQVSPTEISVIATAGFLFTIPRPAGKLRIGGFIDSDATTTQTLTVNATNVNTAPRMPDAGYVGLKMIDSPLPATVGPGDMIHTLSSGVSGDYVLLSQSKYFVFEQQQLIGMATTVPAAGHDELGFNSKFQLSAHGFAGEGLTTLNGAYYIGPRTGKTAAAVEEGRIVESVVIGEAFSEAGTGVYSNAFGLGTAFPQLTNPSSNVGIGKVAFTATDPSANNVIIGPQAAELVTQLNQTVILGDLAGSIAGFHLSRTVAIGDSALSGIFDATQTATMQANVAVGSSALQAGDVQSYNTAVGADALRAAYASTGNGASANVAMGYQALEGRTGQQHYSVGVGYQALRSVGAGQHNVAVGAGAMEGLAGNRNVGIGSDALSGSVGTMDNNTAIGYGTMMGLLGVVNSTAIGNGATVTGSNQVQLGNSETTTYTYGAVQSRSDERDKTDIRPTSLGLDFILGLEAVDFRYDYREDYLDASRRPVPPTPPGPEPQMPDISEDSPNYEAVSSVYQTALQAWQQAQTQYENDKRRYERELQAWKQYMSLSGIEKDGSKAHKRFHHGFIAQRVKAVVDMLGVEFGGYQDHALKGGRDVKSLGYEEFIAPIVKAIQELHAKLHSDETIERVSKAILDELTQNPDHPLVEVLAQRLMEKMIAARRSS